MSSVLAEPPVRTRRTARVPRAVRARYVFDVTALINRRTDLTPWDAINRALNGCLDDNPNFIVQSRELLDGASDDTAVATPNGEAHNPRPNGIIRSEYRLVLQSFLNGR